VILTDGVKFPLTFILKKSFIEPVVEFLNREGSVTQYYAQLKLYSAAIGLIAIEQLNDLGNVFKTLQDVLQALQIFDNTVTLMKGWGWDDEKKVAWYKQVSNCIRWAWSVIDCVKIFEKYFGCKPPSIFNIINKPKDALVVIDSIWNLIVINIIRLFSKKGREELLQVKTIFDAIGYMGKIILIATAADYAITLAFRVTALVVSFIALVKQWAYPK
jgi:hypothetical protein